MITKDRIRNNDRDFDFALFLVLFFSYAYFFQGGFANANSRFDLTMALAFEHRFTTDSFHYNTIDKVFFNGHFYSEKAPGAAYLALPIPLLVSLFLNLGDLFRHPGWANLLLYISTVFSLCLLSAWAGVCFSRAIRLLNPQRTHGEAAWVSFVVFATTLILPYSTTLFGHQLAGAFLVIGTYFGLRAAKEVGRFGIDSSIAVMSLGMAVLCEYPAAAPAICVAAGLLLIAKSPRRMLRYAPIAMIPGVFLLLHNYLSFGDPVALGYGKLEGTQFATQMSQGFFGVRLPKAASILQLTIGRYRGLFYYSPVLVAALIGFWWWPRRELNRLGYAFIGAAACALIINASYGYWQGGVCFGPRHLVMVIPLLGFGLAYLPSRWLRSPAMVLLVLVSALINLVGTATTLSVSEYDTDPLFQSYYGLVRDRAISINPMDFLAPVSVQDGKWMNANGSPWASFNLGECMGLRGWWSILPLILVWLAWLGWISHASVKARLSKSLLTK